jgi:hypothetical protein
VQTGQVQQLSVGLLDALAERLLPALALVEPGHCLRQCSAPGQELDHRQRLVSRPFGLSHGIAHMMLVVRDELVRGSVDLTPHELVVTLGLPELPSSVILSRLLW